MLKMKSIGKKTIAKLLILLILTLKKLNLAKMAISLCKFLKPEKYFVPAYELGRIYLELSEWKLAKAYFQIALKRRPKSIKVKRKLRECKRKSRTNIAVIDTESGLIYHLAQKLKRHNAHPKLWVGYPRHLNKAVKSFPNCEFFSYWHFTKGASLLTNAIGPQQYSPPAGVLKSGEFKVLKDSVLKMMDRQDDFGIFRRQEREALFYSLFFLYYSKVIEKKIDLLISAYSPHVPSTMVLFGVCKILKIKTAHCREYSNVPFIWLAKDFEGNNWPTPPHFSDRRLHIDLIEKHIHSYQQKSDADLKPNYMLHQELKAQSVKKLPQLTFEAQANIKERNVNNVSKGANVNNPPKSRLSYRIDDIDFLHNNEILLGFNLAIGSEPDLGYIEYIRELQSHEYASAVNNKIEVTGRFVYFPLHYEPEKTSNPDGGKYYNCYDAIASLRSLVPIDVPILIKEHPTQFNPCYRGFVGRSYYFYRSVLLLPNTHFIGLSASTFELIRNAEVVATQTGTAAIEAACLGKKAIIFGSNWYSDCPNIFQFDSISNYSEVLNEPLSPPSDIAKSMAKWLNNYSIHGLVTYSAMRTAKRIYPDTSFLINRRQTINEIEQTLIYNKLI